MSKRDELARLLFVADNWRQPEEESLKDWEEFVGSWGDSFYTYPMADAVLAAGYTKA